MTDPGTAGDNVADGSAGGWREGGKPLHFGGHETASLKVTGAGEQITAREPALAIRKRPNGNRRPMRFVSLHHHSTYSYLDGYQLPEAHVRRAAELNMSAIAVTEHGNVDSHVMLEQACADTGVKALFGCEVYMPTTRKWMDSDTQTQSKHHLTILAKDAEGYRNLLALVTGAWQDFYYDPVVTWERLVKHQRGLIVLSGCQGSLLSCCAVGGKGISEKRASYKRALRVAQLFAETFDDYYIEVQAFPELEKTRRFNSMAGRLARAVGVKLVATLDCHYTMLEEQEVQKILHNLRPGEKRTIEEQAREWGYKAPLCPPPNDNTIYRRLRATGLTRGEAVEAVVSTEEIAQQCTATLPKLPMVKWPHGDAVATWRRLLNEGWRARGLHRLRGEERTRYLKQLRYEIEMIESKRFVDYFLLVQAGVRHVKELGYPNNARGSAVASLAAYLLRITEVDPLRPEFAGLLRFERFIDITREDLPDIDIDFPSEARPLLRRFYEEMLGPGCVSNIGLFTFFKNKLAVDDVARVFKVPAYEVDKLKNFLIERSSGDLRASSTIEDTAEQFEAAAEIFDKYPDLKKAQLLEGQVKSFGVHAAGLALSNEPITNVTALAEREVPKGSGNFVQVVALDKRGAARQGVLKMDFLGLNTMSMLWRCLNWLGKTPEWLYGLPLDDKAIYERFQAGDLMGIFQLEGRAARYVCNSIKPEKLSEIMDCIALCRPGPILNGAASAYAETKAGRRKVDAVHPAWDAVTAVTKGQLVYQEQILAMARDIGGFDAKGVATIRTIISRKRGEQEFRRQHDLFVRGAASRGVDTDTAEFIWNAMVTSGAYSFNGAHSASYALLGYWTMYMKLYHPAEFYAAQMTEADNDKERTHEFLRDAAKHGIDVKLPDLMRSSVSWRPAGRRSVRAGFRQLPGFGPKKAAGAYAWARGLRGAVSPAKGLHWANLAQVPGVGPKTVETVTAWLASEDPFGAFALDRHIQEVTAALEAGELGDLPVPTHTSVDLDGAAQGRRQSVKAVWLGTLVRKPNIRDIFENARARGLELDPDRTQDAHLREMALMTGEDSTERVMLKCDRWRFPAYKESIIGAQVGKDLLLVEGVKPGYSSQRQLDVRRMWVIDPE